MSKYTCAICGGIFEKARTDEEALEESRQIFGDIPKEEMEIVCDDCYEKIKPEKFPITVKVTKAAISKAKKE